MGERSRVELADHAQVFTGIGNGEGCADGQKDVHHACKDVGLSQTMTPASPVKAAAESES